MPDLRFFHRAGPFLLSEIAALVDAEISEPSGEPVYIHDIATLESAQPGEISVFTGVRHLDALLNTRAGAILISRDLAGHARDSRPLMFVKDPRLAYAQVGQLFYPPAAIQAGIDPAARVDPSATVGEGTRIDAGAVIGRGVYLGARCHISFNAVLGDGVRLGDDSTVGANTSISHAVIGRRVGIDSGVTIGSQGFGFVPSPNGLTRMLQLGRVVIEDGVQIGANSAIDRGTTEDTLIGAGTVIDNLVQIGHNVRLGRYCVICAQVGIAGSTVVGDGVMMGGQAGIADHLKVGARARLAARSGVTRNVEAGAVVGGFPAIAIKAWHRQTAGLARLFRRTPGETADK